MKISKTYINGILALAAGLLLAASWPTYGITFLTFFAFVPLFFVERNILMSDIKRKAGHVFGYAFITFAIFNTITTWWIANSSMVAGFLACGLNSLFMATVFLLYFILRKNIFDHEKGQWILIPWWVAFEKLHYTWELNWPWLNLGNVFATKPYMVQWYEYTGVLGGTVWILLVNILIFNILQKSIIFGLNIRRNVIKSVIALIIIVLLPVTLSLVRYYTYIEEGESINVVVYQPNSDPYSEQFRLSTKEVLQRFTDNVSPVVDENTDYIVCPESMMQENVSEKNPNYIGYITQYRDFLHAHAPNAAIIVGAATFRYYDDGEKVPASARKVQDKELYYDVFNTAWYVDTSQVVQRHHKSKLTPGVEIMPYIKYLPFLNNLALDLGGTVGTLGMEEEYFPFNHNDATVAKPVSAICYESVFGEYVSEYTKVGGNVIFISTNDGWWRETQGHKQHCEYASLLAIETRRDIARSANTGISCFVNQRGDISEKTNYWERDVETKTLCLNDEVTFYSKHGDYLSKIAIAVLVALAGVVTANKLDKMMRHRA